MPRVQPLLALYGFLFVSSASAQTTQSVVDIPTRAGVTQRMMVLAPPAPQAAVVLLAGFRQTAEHTADLKAVIAWLRESSKLPVWLVGTSRGTQSVAYVATELSGSGGPDGLVLTSSILTETKGRPLPAMALGKLQVPVLVVHHTQDGCALCAFSDTPALMAKLTQAPRSQLLTFTGGDNKGDPCEALAYHGFSGLEPDVVRQIAGWVLAKP